MDYDYDIITGWLTDEDEVEPVSIDGGRNLILTMNSGWVQSLKYHAFMKNKNK